ncbi:MAG TPA: hypothetical protein VKP60_12235 [Magnetospirillaceae bacterium]|nr:hypothetical protein [Magnetospirillaceae bacterium]
MPHKIPVTLGFANHSGSDLDAMMSEDVAALSPLFANVMVTPLGQTPRTSILFLYAHLNENGTLQKNPQSGIRQIVQMTGSPIIVLASPNSPASVQNAANLPGPKTANMILTLERKNGGFAKFFRSLFEMMRDGEQMLTAWVTLAPQMPNAPPSAIPADIPATILVAEAGNLKFPPPAS